LTVHRILSSFVLREVEVEGVGGGPAGVALYTSVWAT